MDVVSTTIGVGTLVKISLKVTFLYAEYYT